MKNQLVIKNKKKSKKNKVLKKSSFGAISEIVNNLKIQSFLYIDQYPKKLFQSLYQTGIKHA